MSTPLDTPAKLWKRWAISWLAAAACGPVVGAGGAALALRFASGLEALPFFFVGSLVPSFIAGLLIGRRVAGCVPQKAGRAQRAAVMVGFVLISVSLSLAAGIQLISSALRVQGVGIATAAWPVGLLGCAAGLVATMAPLIAMAGAKRDRNASDWTEPVELEAWPDEAPSSPEPVSTPEVWVEPTSLDVPAFAETWREDQAEPGSDAGAIETAPVAGDVLESAPVAGEKADEALEVAPTGIAVEDPAREEAAPVAEHFAARAFSEQPELPASDEAAYGPPESAESVTASPEHEAAPSAEPEVLDPTLPDAALPSLAVVSYDADDPSQLFEEELASVEPASDDVEAFDEAPVATDRSMDIEPLASDEGSIEFPEGVPELIGESFAPEPHPIAATPEFTRWRPDNFKIQKGTDRFFDPPARVEQGTHANLEIRWEPVAAEPAHERWEPAHAPRFFSTSTADEDDGGPFGPPEFQAFQAERRSVLAGSPFVPPTAVEGVRPALTGSPMSESFLTAVTPQKAEESAIVAVSETLAEPARSEDPVAEHVAVPARSEDVVDEAIAEAVRNEDVVDEAEPVAEPVVHEDVVDEAEPVAEPVVNADVADETEPEPETYEHPPEEPAAPYEVEPPPSVMFSVVEFEPMRQQGRRRGAPVEAPRSKSKQGPRRGSRRRSA